MDRRRSTLLMAGAIALPFAAKAAEPTFRTRADVDTRNGLTINGEAIADAKTLADARAEGSLVLYTSAGEDYERQFAERFRSDTGVEVKIVRLVVGRLSERVLSEHNAQRTGADVIRMSDAATVKMLQDGGVFQPYRVPFDKALDEGVKASASGHFYRYSSSVYTVGYNSELVKGADVPKSWRDLIDPKWKGRIGIVNITAGGSSAALARFMQQKLGDGYLAAYAAQGPRIFESASGLLTSMARGEIVVGHVIPARVRVARESGAPITFIIPEEGVSGWDFYIGLTAATRKASARLFVNWVMSRYGQQLLADLGDYPGRADVNAPTVMDIALPPLSRVFRLSVEDTTRMQAGDQEFWFRTFRRRP